MKLGSLSVGRDVLAGGIVIGAVTLLAATNNVSGSAALAAILGVGASLGVYRKARGGTDAD